MLNEKGHLADFGHPPSGPRFVLVRRLGGAGNHQSDERDDQEKPIHITVRGSSLHPVRLLAGDLVPNQRSLEGIFMQQNTNIKNANESAYLFVPSVSQ